MSLEKTQLNVIDQSRVEHEENGNFDRSWREEKWGDRKLSAAAQEVAHADQELSIRDAVKYYPNAIGWSLLISTCVIMEGYDTNLLGNFFAYLSFQRRFGDFVGITEQTPSGYQLKPAWTAGVSQAAGVGTFFGVLLNGTSRLLQSCTVDENESILTVRSHRLPGCQVW